jgi:uncharacterized protein (DUF305 family)
MRIHLTSHRDTDLAKSIARAVARAARRTTGIIVAGVALSSPQSLAGQSPGGGTNNPADVQFMQGMIAHHAQALAMVALISTNTTRPELQMIGERIRISQQDEIGMMQRWLTAHHEVVPTVDSNNVAHMPPTMMPGMQMSGTTTMMMPGMLTPEQMTQLANAKGMDFDTLFLKGMIRHHEGALLMVKDLFGTNGAAQAPEVFTFASDADADQRAEIKRMQTVLTAIGSQGHKS